MICARKDSRAEQIYIKETCSQNKKSKGDEENEKKHEETDSIAVGHGHGTGHERDGICGDANK